MAVRRALPTELGSVLRFALAETARSHGVVGSVLPTQLAASAVPAWQGLLPGMIGLRSRVRVYLEEHRARMRAVAIVYASRRPEWVLLLLVSDPTPEGTDASFRLLSSVCLAAARDGRERVFGAAPDETRARETFFQAGFYSYTRESWFLMRGAVPEPSRALEGHLARGRDAHDLYRFYAMTTPHAVQRAEQVTVEDFDVGRYGSAFEAPHIGGDPLAMRRTAVLVATDAPRVRGVAVAYRGTGRHPHVCKVRTADGDADLARELLRAVAQDLPPGPPLISPVRAYEDHVARALQMDGASEVGTAMLFAKELAQRIEEPVLAPAVVR